MHPLRPHPRKSVRRDRRLRRRAGFTLIEAALTTVIVGTGVLAMVAAQQAYHIKNQWATKSNTAMLLANELRELTLAMPPHDPITGSSNLGPEPDETTVLSYDDLDDFAGTVTSGVGTGTTFSPPINALRTEIPDMTGWSQHIEVAGVLPDYLNASFTQPLASTDVTRMTVTVSYQGPSDPSPQTMTSLTWVIAD